MLPRVVSACAGTTLQTPVIPDGPRSGPIRNLDGLKKNAEAAGDSGLARLARAPE